MCSVHWGSVGVAMLTASTLAFAASNGEMTDGDSRSCNEVADGPRQLRVRMIGDSMKAAMLQIARDEVTAIWKQYGVEIVWQEQWTPAQPKPDLWVQFVDLALTSTAMRGLPAVAWIPFAHGVPRPYVRVSRPNAMALLRTPSWFDGRPLSVATEDLQNQALGRIVGRAVAHEIGHFLLSTQTHASSGLMRAALDPERMVNPGVEDFKLQASSVRALRAARIASCEIALRQ